jgi:hypothetical protein
MGKMKTGTQPRGNNIGAQGIKLTGETGKPAAKKPATNIASGKKGSGSGKNRSAGAAGGGMGIGSLGGGKKRGFK